MPVRRALAPAWRAHGMALPARCRLPRGEVLQTQGHEGAVGVFGVVAEGAAIHETEALIEPLRRLERFCRPRFQAQACVASRSGHLDHVHEEGAAGTFAPQCLGRTHGFDLAVRAVEFF